MRSNQLSYPAIGLFAGLSPGGEDFRLRFVEIEGLEPSLTEPESVVLPLHHISIFFASYDFSLKSPGPVVFQKGLQRYKGFVKSQIFLRFFPYFLRRTVAKTSQPSQRPTKPSLSVVVALTETLVIGTSIRLERVSRILVM